MQWIDTQKVAFIARIRKDVLVDGIAAGKWGAGKRSRFGKKGDVLSLTLYFAKKSLRKDGRAESLLVVSNVYKAAEALELYRMRWGIERLFSHLKKRGFDLEATHLTEAAKLEKLFGLVTLAFLFSYAWGCHLKKSRDTIPAQSKRKSLFRLGLEDIRHLFSSSATADPLQLSELQSFLCWLKSRKFTAIFLV